MNIALIGYGKMGKAIENIAAARGHHVVLRIQQANTKMFTKENLQQADVAIEFTNPHAAPANVKQCLEWNIPVVCGSTGWTEQLPHMQALCEQHNGAFIYASNFSIGVNIFFELNRKLASLMADRADYDVSMLEIHHTQKKDAPSGTAISLAEQIIAASGRKTTWVGGSATKPEELGIASLREDPAPGTHHVKYSSTIDDIEIIHTAHSRDGFASGAVQAAEFLRDKKGFFTMKDVLGL